MAQIKAMGVTLIVNNRPDRESSDQPDGAEIEAAAQDERIAYREIPITMGGAGEDDIAALAKILQRHGAKRLLYCRSGTRSALLWGLAQAQLGRSASEICAAIEAAGFRSGPVRASIERMAAGRAA